MSRSDAIEVLFQEFSEGNYQRVRAERRQKLIKAIRREYREHGLALYLGAGFSCSVGLPSWRELIYGLAVTKMAQDAYQKSSGLSGRDPNRRTKLTLECVAQIREHVDPRRPVLMLARMLKEAHRTELPNRIAGILYGKTQGKGLRSPSRGSNGRRPTPPAKASELVNALIELCRPPQTGKGIKAVVNYNFDDFFECFLDAEQVDTESLVSGDRRESDRSLPTYHVHGMLPYADFKKRSRRLSRSPIVFSEDEYHAEYAATYKWSNLIQTRLLSNYAGLFVGLSMEDPNIRRLIDLTHKQFSHTQHFAIIPRWTQTLKRQNSKTKRRREIVTNLFEEMEWETFEKLGVNVIWVNHHDEVPDVIKEIRKERVAR